MGRHESIAALLNIELKTINWMHIIAWLFVAKINQMVFSLMAFSHIVFSYMDFCRLYASMMQILHYFAIASDGDVSNFRDKTS